jgi:predicted metal-dependent hydrolase
MSHREQIHLLQGRPLRLRLCRSARARNLRLTVSRRGGAVVTLPRWATRRDVDQALSEAQDWLVRQVTLHDVWDGPRQRSWTSGSEVALLGRRVRLELRPLTDGRQRRRATLTGDVLRLELPIDEFLDPRPAIERWLRAFAGRHLRERTQALGRRLGLQPRRILVGERTTRWGSCSGRGTISYCYRLVMAPPDVVDAVVIHELCHLVHPDHGPRWRAMVEAACPEHTQHMAWLRQHGEDLEF